MPVPLTPNQPVKLLEGNWLHDAQVTGQTRDFVSIYLPTGLRLVRRSSIYALPGERVRLQQDLQAAIDQLQSLMVKLSRMEDCEEIPD